METTIMSLPPLIAPEAWSRFYADKLFRTVDFSSVKIPERPSVEARLIYVHEPRKIIELAFARLIEQANLRSLQPALARVMDNESCHRNSTTVPYAVWMQKCPTLQPGATLGHVIGIKPRPSLAEAILYLLTEDPGSLQHDQIIVASETKIMSHFVCICIKNGSIGVNYSHRANRNEVPVVALELCN